MTTAATDADRLQALIHETGYWRVVTHPSVFEPARIARLSDAWRIVEDARVSQRGWDYPFIDRANKHFEDDWVQCGIALDNFIELWRFYQSGQFVHEFAVTEDREDRWSLDGTREPSPVVKGPRTLSFLNLLYTFCEVLEFARRLAHRQVLAPAAGISVELHGMKGRRLTSPQYRRLSGNYVSNSETICWRETIQVAVLIATAPRIAIDATVAVLERFNWMDPPRRVLEEEQWRFYEKRW
jgi:hypothetical protein